jgi:starch-binding outer membrane protein, SusD/RagB family
MKKLFNISLITAALIFVGTACTKDLDTVPLDKDVLSPEKVYENPASYKMVLAKLYAGNAVSGQQGPAGNADISGIDEGFGQYLRGYWYHQELTTDEAVIGWNDQTIKDFHYQQWGSSDVFISAMYSRIFYQIALCNEYIRETTDAKLDSRNVSGQIRTDVQHFRAEARFLRALAYYHALDLFGNVPFVTEADQVGKFFPNQISRSNLFTYIEGELKAIDPLMIDARQNEYGRADKGAVWTLLAKLYLNAEVYTGTAKYSECLTYCNQIIGAGYSLEPTYKNLFLADNNNLNEVIFSINFDGRQTQTWGGTTFLVHAPIGGSMVPAEFGVKDGWGGVRATSAFVGKFADPSGNTDKRAMFYTDGQSLEIADVSTFTEGYAIAKWRNVSRTGAAGSDLVHVDTDFPMFRLADVYLMYAEVVAREAGGDAGTALGYINALRQRAYGNASGNITANQLTLDFILDERARELFWEGYRRTDLIRFGKFSTGDYVWPWKGGTANGRETDSHLNIFPIPASDLTANPNLHQNLGY